MKKIIGWTAWTVVFAMTAPAQALELDWSGQFRAETNMVYNYTLDSSNQGSVFNQAQYDAKGYYIPSSGQRDANFQTLFLKLKPRLVVNDNILVRSEFWVGDPVFGLFGNAVPYSLDQRQFYSNQSRGSAITGQRFWAEVITDFGTLHVGRAPLNWGLGLVWNSGDGLWDRYQTTGDAIRLVSRFGAFSFIPGFVSYSMGNTIGGTCSWNADGTQCVRGQGTGGLSEYSLMLKYDNPDEDLEGGVNFIKRIAGSTQDPTSGYFNINRQVTGMNFNIWDIYGKKRMGKLSVAGELPITSGNIGGAPYSTFAAAAEVDYKISDSFNLGTKLGHAPGSIDKVFYFNPAYRLGLIMFNYQLGNFGGVQSANTEGASQNLFSSPYDNPIVNADYFSLRGNYKTDKWNFYGSAIFARASTTAKTGNNFYNTMRREVVAANFDQESFLGWELDAGTSLQWDDSIQLGLDLGFFFPGAFWAFSNTATPNATNMAFAGAARLGISF